MKLSLELDGAIFLVERTNEHSTGPQDELELIVSDFQRILRGHFPRAMRNRSVRLRRENDIEDSTPSVEHTFYNPHRNEVPSPTVQPSEWGASSYSSSRIITSNGISAPTFQDPETPIQVQAATSSLDF